MNKQTALGPVEMADVLKKAIETNKVLVSKGKSPVAYEIVGEAGTAKSSVAEQVALESGMDYVKINASQITVDDKKSK